MTEKKKVLGFVGDVAGCAYYRILLPFWVMDNKGTYTTSASMIIEVSKFKWNPNTIVFARQHKSDVQEVIKLWKNAGKRIVYETDDNLMKIPITNQASKIFTRDIGKEIVKTIKLCDVVTVSTKPLQEFYSKYHENVMITPNCIVPEFLGIKSARRKEEGIIRIGWAGSNTHGGDFSVCEAALIDTAKKYNNVKFIFFGWAPPRITKELPGNKLEFYSGVPIDKYHKALLDLNLDIGLAPLQDNEFNRGKSNLKVLEYGLLGVPCIASDVYPYTNTIKDGEDGSLVKDKYKSWMRALSDMIENESSRISQGRAIKVKILRDYNLFTKIDLWEKAYFPEDFV